MQWLDGEEIITKGEKILAVKKGNKLVEEKWNIIHDNSLGQTWEKGVKSSLGYFTLKSKQYGLFLTATTNTTNNLDVQGNVTISLLLYIILIML